VDWDSSKLWIIWIFGKICPKGTNPLDQLFTKVGVVEGVSGLPPHAKFQHRGFRNVGISLPKSSKYGTFGINLPLRGHSIKWFLQIWHGEGVPDKHPHAKFHPCACKNVGLQPSNLLKLLIFGINLPQRSISPSAIFFTKFVLGVPACLSPYSDQIKTIKVACRRVQILRISKNIVKTNHPRGANLWTKFEILTVFDKFLPW